MKLKGHQKMPRTEVNKLISKLQLQKSSDFNSERQDYSIDHCWSEQKINFAFAYGICKEK